MSVKEITDTGTVTAVVATLGVKDHDGDVTLPGFFGEQHPGIVASHDWSDILLGKGTLTEDGDRAVFEGRFNLDDPDAQKLHSKLVFDVANPPAQIEWSYGYALKDGARQTFADHPDYGSGAFLGPVDDGPGVTVFEVSPVLRAAGIGTGTTTVKELDPGGGAGNLTAKFSDEIAAAVAAAESVCERAEAIMDLRPLGGKSKEQIGRMAAELQDAATAAKALTAEPGLTPTQVESLKAIRTIWRRPA